MPFDFQSVPLTRIDPDDETLRITTQTALSPLAAGITRAGLINPPVLLPRGGQWVVVCGFRRIAAVRQLKWTQLPARILSPETPHADCVRMAIADNAFQRPLNHIETSRALALLSTTIPEPLERTRIARELGLPSAPSLIEKLIPLCRLPDVVQKGIVANTISLPVAERLGGLDTDVAIFFGDLFNSLNLSLNKQREVLTLSEEISLREDRSLMSVFQEGPIHDTLNDPDQDRSQKAGAVRRQLKLRRYPHLTRAKDDFESAIKSIKFPNTVKLTPPADFEGTRYTLHLSFSGLSELHSHRSIFELIEGHPTLRRLIDTGD